MKVRFAPFAALLAAFVLLLPGQAGDADAAGPCAGCINGQNMVTDSYYRLDVPSGTFAVRVEALVELVGTNGAKEVPTVTLFAMPSAVDVVVKMKDGDKSLPLTIVAGNEGDDGLASRVTATLEKPARSGNRVDIVMTYTVSAHTSELVRMEPGAIETVFVGQGPGSFVIVDVPTAGDTFFDPGCLKGTAQPSAVRDAGLERWVCGEVTIAAFFKDDPATQKACADMADKCRQRIADAAFSAFVQSVTDPSLLAKREADLTMPDDRIVHLVFKYFRRDQAWANRQFEVGQLALPKLEALFGFKYPFDTVTIRESHHIELLGAAGISYWSGADVLISPNSGFDDEVTVHELAHQWAGSQFIRERWAAEGLAEWAAATLAPDLGFTKLDRGYARYRLNFQLAEWGSAPAPGGYWYGKSGAFWHAFQAAVGGPENMTKALGMVDDRPGRLPLDGRAFLDNGEAVSGANLDALFLTWVYVPETATALLEERRAAHSLVKALTTRAAEAALPGVPIDIQVNLDEWVFKGIASQVLRGHAVLDSYAAVVAEGAAAGLPASAAVAASWGTQPLAGTQSVVDSQRNAIHAIVAAGERLASGPEDAYALDQLALARDKYIAGDMDGAHGLAAGSTTAAFNKDAAERILALAKETQAAFKPSFMEKLGLMLANPKADLAAAEKAYAAGDYETALKKSRSAQETWDGAARAGMMGLGVLFGAMAMLTAGAVFLLRQLEQRGAPTSYKGRREGHALASPDERKNSWADWENNGRGN